MWQSAKATWLRNQVSNMRAYPWTFTFGHIIEQIYVILVAYFAFHFLIRGQLDERFADYAGTNDYLTFAIIGGMMSSLSVSMMMNVSRSLITEWREGTLEVLLLAPASRSGYFIGTAVQQLYRVGIEFLPALFLAVLLGVRVPNADWLSALLGFFLFMMSCFAMALVLGAIMLFTRDTYIVQNTLFTTTALVCGFLYPTTYLPVPLQWLGETFPLTEALFLVRDSLLKGTPIWEHPNRVGIVIILSILYTGLGAWMTRQAERTVFERKMA